MSMWLIAGGCFFAGFIVGYWRGYRWVYPTAYVNYYLGRRRRCRSRG